MKANELMVGDWVYCIYIEKYCQVFEIKKVADDILKVVVLHGDTPLVFRDVYIEPIPITPEILEKNGFKNIGDDCWQLEEHPNYFWVDFYTHQYGCEHAITFDSDEHRLKLYGIPNVHELQHALRLCGIEKEIAL